MTRAIEDLLPGVLTFAPTAPEPLVLRYIREAARELCHDVRVWRVWHTLSVTNPPGQGIVTIPDAEIVEIQLAQLDDHKLEPVTVAWLDDHHPGWDVETELSGGRYVTQTNPRLLSIYPRAIGSLKVRLVLQPSLDCTTLPDVLVELHGTVVSRGAASRLLATPAADFANPSLAVALYGEFKAKITSLKIEHTKGQQGARLRTTGAYF